eukprot:CAMPEP_0183482670 /NCGR_PEP_ID=MMETSP0370-20130417/177085_1 /TAXON_ID=268820 /ORGANISM="Peridinium aciculiferum, Strain PAER-2" /LENGTH=81 /DNA_ID=CAMNT_0025675873 /DNA_START=124 /DNA_END=365 /DNA_ORIENTATION=+
MTLKVCCLEVQIGKIDKSLWADVARGGTGLEIRQHPCRVDSREGSNADHGFKFASGKIVRAIAPSVLLPQTVAARPRHGRG